MLLLMIAATGSAQLPAAGDPVRVWGVNPELNGARGTVRRLAADTIVFSLRSAVSREWLDTPIQRRNIRRIDVPAGRERSRRRTIIGYATGTVLGLGAGGYITWRYSRLYCNTTPCGDPDVETPAGAVAEMFKIAMGSVAGATMGGAIGWAIGRRPVNRWRQVYP